MRHATDASGGTDIYEGLLSALDELPSESEASQYTTAIVLMTDGRSNSDHQDEFESAYKSRGRDLPIFSIMFGGLRVKMCVWLGVSRGLDLAFLNAD